MTSTPACSRLEERALDVLEGAPDVRDLVAHAADCAACAAVLEEHRRLEEALRNLPPAPSMDVPRPSLPAGKLVRRPLLLRGVGMGAAAALLVAVGVALMQGEESRSSVVTGTIASTSPLVGTLEQETTLLDDDLLALTMGYEAVAMKRTTELR